MAPRREDGCGARFRRAAAPDSEPHVPESAPLALTPLGAALIDALRDDERFRDVVAHPFGEEPGPDCDA